MPARLLLILPLTWVLTSEASSGIVVLQSDFGLRDQAVAAMRGVIASVDRDLSVHDLTHEIPAFDVWEASYRLAAVIRYWPAGTVFVSVVDPGVGTKRKSVVARTRSGHYVVTPDNGTLTLVADGVGIEALREIDEGKNRLPGSRGSYTFHGRDVYAYTAARLASGKISFADVGPVLPGIVRLPYQRPVRKGESAIGTIDVLDPQFGNVWSNLPRVLIEHMGSPRSLSVCIAEAGRRRYAATLPLVHTFGDVPLGAPLAYFNSLGNLALALNQGSFATRFAIGSGPDWRLVVRPVRDASATMERVADVAGCGGAQR